jgi:hypothetical protein
MLQTQGAAPHVPLQDLLAKQRQQQQAMQPPMQHQVPGPQQQQQQQPLVGQAGRNVVVWGTRSTAPTPSLVGGAGPSPVHGRTVSTGTPARPNLATNPGVPAAQQLQRLGPVASGTVAPAMGFPVVPPGRVQPPAPGGA